MNNLFKTALLFGESLFSAEPELLKQIEEAQKAYYKIQEQEKQQREERLRKERENYKYGFQEIENFQTIIGNNVLIERTGSKFGYLTYEGNIIDDEHVLELHDVESFLRELNQELNNGKKFRFNNVVDVKPLSPIVKEFYEQHSKQKIKGKTKIISQKCYIFDIQNHKYMFKLDSHLDCGYIYENILYYKSKYIFIPTNTVVVDTNYSYSTAQKNKNENIPIVYDTSHIHTDKYIIFKTSKFDGSFRKTINGAYKLNKLTGEFIEIE